MCSKTFPTYLQSLLLLFTCSFLPGSNSLIAVHLRNLPEGLCRLSPYYDGTSDTIYLFGGDKWDYSDYNSEIYSFSLTNHTLQSVGQIPAYRTPGILPVFPSENGKEVLYIVSTDDKSSGTIFKFDTADGSSQEVGQIPFRIALSGFTKYGNYSFIFGGEYIQNNIYKLDLESETIDSEVVGTLKQYFQFAVSARVNNTAFIFGTEDGFDNPYNHITLNLDTMESSDLRVKLPTFYFMPSVVTSNRDEVFLFGFNDLYRNGIVRINAVTQALDFIPVFNLPLLPGGFYLNAPAAVYVEKLNRIYFFGGSWSNLETTTNDDRVWYVNL